MALVLWIFVFQFQTSFLAVSDRISLSWPKRKDVQAAVRVSKVRTCKVGTRTFLNKPLLFYWKPTSQILVSWVLHNWWITLVIVASFFFWFFLFNNVFKCFAFGNVEPKNGAVTCESIQVCVFDLVVALVIPTNYLQGC